MLPPGIRCSTPTAPFGVKAPPASKNTHLSDEPQFSPAIIPSILTVKWPATEKSNPEPLAQATATRIPCLRCGLSSRGPYETVHLSDRGAGDDGAWHRFCPGGQTRPPGKDHD